MCGCFINRTALPILGVAIPACLAELDDALTKHYGGIPNAVTSREGRLAENLARRFADIYLFASHLQAILGTPDKFRAAILAGSYLTAYFVSVKSFLDSMAICLTDLYQLGLPPRLQDFNKRKFWDEFRQRDATAHAGYVAHRTWYASVRQWRDSAVHRVSPFVIVHSPGAPETAPAEAICIKMVDEPDTAVRELVNRRAASIRWVEPMHYPNEWQTKVLDNLQLVCEDIWASIRSRLE